MFGSFYNICTDVYTCLYMKLFKLEMWPLLQFNIENIGKYQSFRRIAYLPMTCLQRHYDVTRYGIVLLCLENVQTPRGKDSYGPPIALLAITMMTSSNGNIFRFTGEFPVQRPVTRGFDVFFDLRLNERLNKQSWGWWFETPSCLLCCHMWIPGKGIWQMNGMDTAIRVPICKKYLIDTISTRRRLNIG